MALSNAERQALYRERRAAELERLRRAAKSAEKAAPPKPSRRAKPDLPPPPLQPLTAKQIGALVRSPELAVILAGLEAEGKKNAATIVPGTVAYLTASLRILLSKLAGLPIDVPQEVQSAAKRYVTAKG